MRLRSPPGEEGLIGKAILTSLLALVVLGVAAFDTASILITKYRAADLASHAAFQASRTYRRTEDRRAACRAAERAVSERDERARIPTAGCVVDTAGREVTITVRRTADTFIVGRLSFVQHLARVEAADTLALPG